MTSNWNKLKKKLVINKHDSHKIKDFDGKHSPSSSKSRIAANPRKRKREITEALKPPPQVIPPKSKEPAIPVGCEKYKHLRARIVAMDCEMVGIGINGKHSALARCSIVDFFGDPIYDKFVRPPALVTDFRTQWSGIRKCDLRIDHAISLHTCQEEVAEILQGKLLVGHALKNDLSALMLKHDRAMIRDTGNYRPYMRPHGRKAGKFKPRALRDLTRQHLKKVIQTGEHDSCEDARAALDLYKLRQEEWEDFLKLPKKQAKLHLAGASSTVTIDEEEDNCEDEASTTEQDDVTSSKTTKMKKKVKKVTSIFGLEEYEDRDATAMSIADADKIQATKRARK